MFGFMLRLARLFATIAIAWTCQPVSAVGSTWDPENEADVAEAQMYFYLWWCGYDAGGDFSSAENFTFTNPPDSILSLLKPGLDLFERIYADRLSAPDQMLDYYGVLDLMHDDPVVMAQFREYTISGKFTTDLNDDPAAFLKHMQALSDAATVQEFYVLSGTAASSGSVLVSEDLKATLYTADAPGDNTTPEPKPFKDVLKCLIDQSLLECMADKDLYLEKKFGCVEFTLAQLAYLHRRFAELGNQYGELVWQRVGISWKCPKYDENGNFVGWEDHSHSVCLVIVPGTPASEGPPPTPEVPAQYYLFDSQTGKIIEISPECAASAKCIAKKVIEDLLGSDYDTCQDWQDGTDSPVEPLVSPARPNRPSGRDDYEPVMPGLIPWWKCKDAQPGDPLCPDDPEINPWVRFKKKLEECCSSATRTECAGLAPPQPCDPSGLSQKSEDRTF